MAKLVYQLKLRPRCTDYRCCWWRSEYSKRMTMNKMLFQGAHQYIRNFAMGCPGKRVFLEFLLNSDRLQPRSYGQYTTFYKKAAPSGKARKVRRRASSFVPSEQRCFNFQAISTQSFRETCKKLRNLFNLGHF